MSIVDQVNPTQAYRFTQLRWQGPYALAGLVFLATGVAAGWFLAKATATEAEPSPLQKSVLSDTGLLVLARDNPTALKGRFVIVRGAVEKIVPGSDGKVYLILIALAGGAYPFPQNEQYQLARLKPYCADHNRFDYVYVLAKCYDIRAEGGILVPYFEQCQVLAVESR